MDALDDTMDLQERCEVAQGVGVGAVMDVIVAFVDGAEDKQAAEQLAIPEIHRYIRGDGESITEHLQAVAILMVKSITQGD